jgi:hypothetical protein
MRTTGNCRFPVVPNFPGFYFEQQQVVVETLFGVEFSGAQQGSSFVVIAHMHTEQLHEAQVQSIDWLVIYLSSITSDDLRD